MYTENPTDPTMKITDICEVAKIAKDKNILFAVDNTFLTPFLQRPLDLGASVVFQSLSKYMNGHSDILMGNICMKNRCLEKEMSLAQIGNFYLQSTYVTNILPVCINIRLFAMQHLFAINFK